MLLKIVQVGEPVLRQRARKLTAKEILRPRIQQLIARMRDTTRGAPGVGLAAPQIGLPIQLAVSEDRAPADEERKRETVPFHVIINPTLQVLGDESAEF